MRPLDPRLLRRARAARAYVVLTAGLGVAAAALVVTQAFAIAHSLGPVVEATDPRHGDPLPLDTATLTPWLTLLAAVLLGRVGVAWAQERYARRAARRTVAELREQVVAHAVSRGPRPGHDAASVATLVTRGLDDLEPYLVRFLPQLLLTAIVTPAVVLVVAGLDWVSAIICVVTIPLIPLFMWLVGVMTAGTSERRMRTIERLGTQVLDLVAGLPTLKAFGREIGPGARVRALGDASRRATMGTLRVAFLSGAVLELLTTLSVAIIAVGVGLRLVEGNIDLVPALAVLVLAPEVYLPLRRMGAEFHASTDGVAATERAFALLGSPADRCAHGTGSSPSSEGRTSPAHDEVVLEGVSVRAPGRDVEAPSGLSARIALGTGAPGGGRVVALRGPSGSGKTTTALVVLGLVRPDRGRVLLPSRELSGRGTCQQVPGPENPVGARELEAWWSRIVWVPQRPAIPPGTLHDVVTDGRDVGPGSLVEAARTTGLDHVVESLPDGWRTRVGLGGVGLSVGQRQRVALTAALLAGPDRDLMILDEPTAHLDARGEQVLIDAVRAWRDAGRTVVVVAHRASLLSVADQVIDVTAREVSRAS